MLESLARSYTLPYWQVVRAQMVLLAAEGLRNDQIAAHLNCRREVVSQWRKRFFEQRLAGLEDRPRRGRPATFPPQVRAEVIAMACALPAEQGVPLSRWSASELAREAVQRGIVEQISGVTVWRWLSEDAISPGSSALGSSRATRCSPSAPARSSTSTPATGRASACTLATT